MEKCKSHPNYDGSFPPGCGSASCNQKYRDVQKRQEEDRRRNQQRQAEEDLQNATNTTLLAALIASM
jgi:hypothetical protein